MTGADNFATRHAAWTRAQHDAADAVAAQIAEARLAVVRLSFVDAHGVLRGKTLVAEEAIRTLRQGVNATTTLLMKDLSGKTAFTVFAPPLAPPRAPVSRPISGPGSAFALPALRGAADMVMLPDPHTFKILPWAPHTGWLLCDLFFPGGAPMPLSSRAQLQNQVANLRRQNLAFIAGIEIECHVVRPDGALLNPGYQYLTELRHDALDPLMETLRTTLQALGLPLRTLEVEFGPSQIELTFAPSEGVVPADQLTLIRSAVKQVCRREGYTASFMCRPRLPGVVSSGWHLHQSLRDPSGNNVFATEPGVSLLSPTARHYLAGLLAHAAGSCAFTTPTLNGYKRYRPNTNAPTRACWAEDNRGAMVRAIGAPGDPATRLENRVAEPAANPYLAMAAQIASGLDGIARSLDPGPPTAIPYDEGTPLPTTLPSALLALQADTCLNEAFSPFFVDYFVRLKQAEIDRFNAEVTEWEHNEYFDLL